MQLEVIAIAAVAFVAALALTALVRRLALARGVLDVPNARSSHSNPTPRGGGIATVVATSVTLIALALVGSVPLDLFAAMAGGGVVVALVGFLDDRYTLRAGVRLTVHIIAAVWALAWLGGLPPLRFGDSIFVFGPEGYVLGVLGIVWTLNLFNFMDGIDGIAASEAVFIAGMGALLAVMTGPPATMAPLAVAFAAACGGFLAWNWPPAKIFMGDVGSGYLGYAIAVLALAAARENSVALLVWLILGAVFFVDATVTLLRRLARRERVYEAHRSHAYQWLARRWQSHRRVTVAVLLVNFFWLLPCALVAVRHPVWAGWMVVLAIVPVTVAALLAGAGRAEGNCQTTSSASASRSNTNR